MSRQLSGNRDISPGHMAVGMWAWVLHRITGLALVFYLVLHILVISSSIGGPDSFNRFMSTLHEPFFLVLDVLLMAAVLFHAVNGIRLVLFDFGIGVRNQATLFWIGAAVAFVLWIYGTVLVWPLLAR